MNRMFSLLLGPELTWLLLYGLVLTLANLNQLATPAGNARLESLSWYLPFLGIALSFVPLFWAPGSQWWWLMRIGLAGLIGVFAVCTGLIGGIAVKSSEASGVGTAALILIPTGWVLLVISIGVASIFYLQKWSFRPLLTWMLVVAGLLVGLAAWAQPARFKKTDASAHQNPR